MEQSNETTASHQNLLQSMTFTSVTAKCDCDECCNEGGPKRRRPQIPQAIEVAIQSYKRQQRAEVLVKRTQARALISRSALLKDLAVWELTLPSLAEPLIEYGNPLVYRIIWIRRLHKSLSLKQIGCGILGSKNEEQGRQRLNWTENDVVVVSCKDQKAIGYIVEPVHERVESSDERNYETPPGPAVLYVAKIPSELCTDDDDYDCNDNDIAGNETSLIPTTGTGIAQDSLEIIRGICGRVVQSWKKNEGGGNSLGLSPSEQSMFRESITALLKG